MASTMMSESPELCSGDDEMSGAEEHAIDWLEQLASEPDAIWGDVPPEPVSDQKSATKQSSYRKPAPPSADPETISQPMGAEKQVQGAAQFRPVGNLAPTIKSKRASKEQVQSLVRALEQDVESALADDVVVEETDAKTDLGRVLTGDELPKTASAELGVVPSGEDQAEGSPAETGLELPDYSDELILETDDLMWLEDMEKVPEMKNNPQEDDKRVPANEIDDGTLANSGALGFEESGPESSMDSNPDQVPEDPDEAIAWLERLAARQGAPAEELPTIIAGGTGTVTEPRLEDGFSLSDMDAGEIPEDPDEAMAWLEMLAAKEVANSDVALARQPSRDSTAEAPAAEQIGAIHEPPTTEALSADLDDALGDSLPSGLDEALDWLEELTVETGAAQETVVPAGQLPVVEEPPTPAVAHDVAEALAGAELLFAEPEAAEVTADPEQFPEGLQYDDAEEAMAWLEKLAARQGAPIEELTTFTAPPGELIGDDRVLEEVLTEDAELLDAALDDDVPLFAELEIQEELAPDVEPLAGETAEQAMALPDDSVLDPVLEVAESIEMAAVAPDIVELDASQELEEQALPEELEVAAELETPDEDLAWLDTLGAVDAERWLEAEAAEHEDEFSLAEEQAIDEAQPADELALIEEEAHTLFGTPAAGPGSNALAEARRAMEEGEFDESLTKYSTLVGEGQFLAFLIDDLEALSEQRGPDPSLQRVLGDAYARNGQLRKALESYREALANL